MGRDTGSKHKLSRREGVDLFGTGGAQLERRLSQPPGQQGTGSGRFRRKESEYSLQLREKQKTKRMFGMREAQFRRFYALAIRSREVTGTALLKLLERRLDNVVYRLGFARSRPQARQFVNHGHVLVDGKKVSIPSFLVEPGQVITVRETLRENPDVQELTQYGPLVPAWLERRDGGGVVAREPNADEVEPNIEPQLIVEFYSR